MTSLRLCPGARTARGELGGGVLVRIAVEFGLGGEAAPGFLERPCPAVACSRLPHSETPTVTAPLGRQRLACSGGSAQQVQHGEPEVKGQGIAVVQRPGCAAGLAAHRLALPCSAGVRFLPA